MLMWFLILFSFVDVVLLLVPMLLAVAFMTIMERKMLGAMQSSVGPNIVGAFGVLQPFADALKLVVKETMLPAQSTKMLFYLAPIWTLMCSLMGWCVFPLGSGINMLDYSLGFLLTLAMSSLSIYGILLAGWSANSKYAFLGAVRSTAAMMSYELVLSSAVLLMVLLSSSFSYTSMMESQEYFFYMVPFFPVFILFFIAVLAETSSVPFDLQEAESELVSGFMTEHSSIIFVFFFLAEYCSIVLMSTLTSVVFLGGYNFFEIIMNNTIFNMQSIILALKTCFFCFLFVWFSATLPRVSFDQIMNFAWTGMLPVAVAFLVFMPSVLIVFNYVSTSNYF